MANQTVLLDPTGNAVKLDAAGNLVRIDPTSNSVKVVGTVPISGSVALTGGTVTVAAATPLPVAVPGSVKVTADAPLKVASDTPLPVAVPGMVTVGIPGTVRVIAESALPVALPGPVKVTADGTLPVTGQVSVSGPVKVAADSPLPVHLTTPVALNGPIRVIADNPLPVSGKVDVAGLVGLAGPIRITGPVAVEAPADGLAVRLTESLDLRVDPAHPLPVNVITSPAQARNLAWAVSAAGGRCGFNAVARTVPEIDKHAREDPPPFIVAALINPADSGIDVFVDRISYGASVAGEWTWVRDDIEAVHVHGDPVSAVNRGGGDREARASLYTGAATEHEGGVESKVAYTPASENRDEALNGGLVLRPGQGLCWHFDAGWGSGIRASVQVVWWELEAAP